MVRRLCESIGVTIDAHNAKIGILIEESTTVSSPTERRIDDPTGRDRCEPLEYLADHDRDVIRRFVCCGLIHGQSPGALAPRWKRAE